MKGRLTPSVHSKRARPARTTGAVGPLTYRNTNRDNPESVGASVADGPSSASPHGLAPDVARPGETVLRHWPAPGGRGLLTNRRCLLLGHPHPVHRPLVWSQELEAVRSLSVGEVSGLPSGTLVISGSFGGGGVAYGGVDRTFAVLVDEVPVFVGYPNDCEDVQRWIDDARTSRCLELFGRVVPFRGPSIPGLSPTSGPGTSGPGQR